MKLAIYAASRASILKRGEMWRNIRAAGVNITSSWIDEDGPRQSHMPTLWDSILRDIDNSDCLILYAQSINDLPLKGALVEVGMALMADKPVFTILPSMPQERYFGSWVAHPLVTQCKSLSEALSIAGYPEVNCEIPA